MMLQKKCTILHGTFFLQRAVAERTETMGLIQDLAGIYEQSCIEYEQGRAETFRVIERFGADGGETQNRGLWAYGDNAAFMHWLLAARGLGGKVQLIYADPPFFSKANYEAVAEIPLAEGRRIRHRAYADVWAAGMESYLKMLCVRLLAMRDLLADEGTIWVHLDWHSVHYVKILLDEIFGDRNFVNEIIWQYKSGGSSKRHFARKHDTILVYGKTPKYYLELPKEKSYNRGMKPYRFKGIAEFCDEQGWYTMVNMKDVWNIDMVGRTSAERTGYATQKPEALLLRILEAGSRPGDLVCDFFGGSGTLGAAAGKSGRRWICCDSGAPALAGAVKRFQKGGLAVDVAADAADDTLMPKRCAACAPAAVTATLQTEQLLHSENCRVTVRLLDYRLQALPETLRRSARTDTEAALAEDAISLLDYWCIDDQYDGEVFCARYFAARSKGDLALSMSWEARLQSLQTTQILVKAVDVFGNTAFYRL